MKDTALKILLGNEVNVFSIFHLP